jgi:hypothetical protein
MTRNPKLARSQVVGRVMAMAAHQREQSRRIILVAVEASIFAVPRETACRSVFGQRVCVPRRRATSIRILVYGEQGFWLATKRLSKGRFRRWPHSSQASTPLRVHQARRCGAVQGQGSG